MAVVERRGNPVAAYGKTIRQRPENRPMAATTDASPNRVLPGLPDHPQAELIRKQQNGGGIVIGFEVADQEAAWKVVDGVALFSRTANLGDVRSTITHPWTTTHGRMQPEEKLAANIRPGLIRLSVGLEHIDDLIDDLQQALNK